MPNQNDPAQKGEAAMCQLPGDTRSHTASRLRAQLLNRRFGLSASRADLVSALAWGALS